MGPPGAGGRAVTVAVIALAVVLHLVVGWFSLVSGLVAPLWAVTILIVLWLAATGVLVVLVRRRPLMAPLVPAANALLWWVLLSAGGLWLDWRP